MSHVAEPSSRHTLRGDSWALMGIFAVLFVAFLAIAIVAQLLTLQWRSWLPGAEESRTLFGGVRAAAYTVMSHLT